MPAPGTRPPGARRPALAQVERRHEPHRYEVEGAGLGRSASRSASRSACHHSIHADTPDRYRVHAARLASAARSGAWAVLAQREVRHKTNEFTQVKPLPDASVAVYGHCGDCGMFGLSVLSIRSPKSFPALPCRDVHVGRDILGEIFISHASADAPSAALVAEGVRQTGHRIFRDSDREDGIAPGAAWQKTLLRELRLCDAMVFLNSRASQASMCCHCELVVATELGKRDLLAGSGPGLEAAPAEERGRR